MMGYNSDAMLNGEKSDVNDGLTITVSFPIKQCISVSFYCDVASGLFLRPLIC